MDGDWSAANPAEVLSFWFPPDLDDTTDEAVDAFWHARMQGGMDEAICRDFAGLTEAAARGLLDHWARTPDGRLALIIALDQFPRSLWRGTPAAYAQDIRAARLALEGLENGHFAALDHVFKKQFYIVAISHCEGPDHLARMDMLVRLSHDLAAGAPDHLRPRTERAIGQSERVREVIRRFGRHPHRNPILGRISTPEEAAYIAAGDFPHIRGPVSAKP